LGRVHEYLQTESPHTRLVQKVGYLTAIQQFKLTNEVSNQNFINGSLKGAPPSIEQYEINRNKKEIGKVFTKVGYGYIGVGTKGQNETYNSEAKRYSGQNRYDTLTDVLNDATESDMSELGFGSQLIFDFDDGTAEPDTLGRHFSRLTKRGLGKNEMATARRRFRGAFVC
jgi:hypothetical protein